MSDIDIILEGLKDHVSKRFNEWKLRYQYKFSTENQMLSIRYITKDSVRGICSLVYYKKTNTLRFAVKDGIDLSDPELFDTVAIRCALWCLSHELNDITGRFFRPTDEYDGLKEIV